MGRPREHDDATRTALIAAAEALLLRDGLAALTVRDVAGEAGTTTRAVYSVFGGKQGLLDGLAQRAFDLLADVVAAAPQTSDPAADLVVLGADGYRGFVREHPWLFRLAFQRVAPEVTVEGELAAARARSFGALQERFERLHAAGRLAERTPRDAAVEFNAMCEGLGNAAVRGGTMRDLASDDERRGWIAAFETLVRGLTTAPG